MEKKILIEPEQWDIIKNFIASRLIPIHESQIGVNVVNAVNSAKEVDAEVKGTKK